MKLRKQAPAKAAIVAITAGLLFAFYGIIHAEPRIGAEAETPAQSPIDYSRFFAPSAAPAGTEPAVPANPHIRTRSS